MMRIPKGTTDRLANRWAEFLTCHSNPDDPGSLLTVASLHLARLSLTTELATRQIADVRDMLNKLLTLYQPDDRYAPIGTITAVIQSAVTALNMALEHSGEAQRGAA